MKKIFTLIALTFALIVAEGQIVVEKKPTILLQVKGGEWITRLERDSAGSDAVYRFLFRSNKYRDLIDVKSLIFPSMATLKEFGEAFKTAQKTQPDDRVTVRDYIIVKSKTMGFTGYTLYYDDGYCELSAKMAQKLIDAIDEYYKINHISTEILPIKPAKD